MIVCRRFIALATFLAIAELLMDFPPHVLRSRKKGCGPAVFERREGDLNAMRRQSSTAAYQVPIASSSGMMKL